MRRGEYPIPSFVFCVMTNYLDDAEMTAFINNTVFTIFVVLTFNEALVAAGIARGIAIFDLVATLSFNAAHQVIYSPGFRERFSSIEDYEAYKAAYDKVENIGNWVVVGGTLITVINAPLRRALRAKMALMLTGFNLVGTLLRKLMILQMPWKRKF